MPRLLRCALLLVFLTIPVFPAGAATVTFSPLPESLEIDKEFSLQVNLIDCTGCGNSYLRGVFSQSGTNYFGQTQNNSDEWVGVESDKTRYFQILKEDLISGAWSGQIKFRPNSDSSFYTGPGTYIFKIGRYTSSSGSASWSATASAQIVLSLPVTPTPTETPEPTPTPTAIPSIVPDPTPTSAPAPDKPRFKFLPKFPRFPAVPRPLNIFRRLFQ